MFAFGSIVLTRFPFTDLSGAKRRPALVVSRDNERRSDLIVCFIISTPRAGPDMASLAAAPGTGLKVPSLVRYDKLATLDRAVSPAKWGTLRLSGWPLSARLSSGFWFRAAISGANFFEGNEEGIFGLSFV